MKKIIYLLLLLQFVTAQNDAEWSLDSDYRINKKGIPAYFYETDDHIFIMRWHIGVTTYIYGIPVGGGYEVYLEVRNKKLDLLNIYDITKKIQNLGIKNINIDGFADVNGKLYLLGSYYAKKLKNTQIVASEIKGNGELGALLTLGSFDGVENMESSRIEIVPFDEGFYVIQNYKIKKQDDDYYARLIKVNSDLQKEWSSKELKNKYYYPQGLAVQNGIVILIREDQNKHYLNHFDKDGEMTTELLEFSDTKTIETFKLQKGKFGDYIIVHGSFTDGEDNYSNKGYYYFKYDYINQDIIEEAFANFDDSSDEEGIKKLKERQEEITLGFAKEKSSSYEVEDKFRIMCLYEVSESELMGVGYISSSYVKRGYYIGSINFSYIVTSFKNKEKAWTRWIDNECYPGVAGYSNTPDNGMHMVYTNEDGLVILYADQDGANLEEEDVINVPRVGYFSNASIKLNGDVYFGDAADFKRNEYMPALGLQSYNLKGNKAIFYSGNKDRSIFRMRMFENVIF